MTEKDEDLIERYYRNDLSAGELAEFERRLKEDEQFWEAAHLHADALEAIRLEGVALLRERLTEKGRALDAQAPPRHVRKWWWVLPVLLLGVLAVWRLTRPEPAQAPALTPLQNTAPVETTSPAAPPVQDAREPAAPARKNDRQIYAAAFRPYRDEMLEPSVRGGDTAPSPSERFQKLYWDGDYRGALTAFDSLGAAARANDNLRFLQANCLLVAGDADVAAQILEDIIRNNRSRFRAEAPWYLAMAYLRSGRRQEAEARLRRIAADAASPRRAEARRVLRELE